MARSQSNYCHKSSGLTLLEVLIALAIVSIALTAIIKASSQAIQGTEYLENKTEAQWVAELVLNEARLNLLMLPSSPDKISNTTVMLNKKWYWDAYETTSANNHIKKIEIAVFPTPEKTAPVMQLTGYRS